MVGPQPRPRTLPGGTYKIDTGHGTVYVTVNRHEGRVFEVFAAIGKSGSCEKAGTEAVSRLISLLLRSGVQADDIIDQLGGIECDPVWTKVEGESVRVTSVPDAIARVLALAEKEGVA